MSQSNRSTHARQQVGSEHSAATKAQNQLRGDLANLGREAGEAARQQAEKLKETASEYVERGREQAAQYMDQGRELAAEYLERGRQTAMELEQTLEQQIRQQPLRAVLTAAGIGFVLGILLARR
jgi:ElaB/YqjD/DUF883 family membrane-anchored ribosome-binding protein